MAGGARQPGRSVTSRVLAVLGAFDADHAELPLTAVAERSGLPLSTAHRLVAELTAWGALTRTAGGSYRVGLRLWELGQLAPGSWRELAHPWLQELSAATRENVHLAVCDGTEVLYVEKVHGRRAVPIASRVGGRLPLHTTGVGKVLLAWRGAEFVHTYLARELERPTPYALTEPGRLHRELEEVRRRGWASTAEEMTLGSCSLAVPVRRGGGASGRVVAAVGVVVAASRTQELPRLLPALLRTAEGIGRGVAGGA
ncbi:DNA-binding IclR family transcriptional regulator [Kineococcus xinjiangensis]|uniref:Glycerol operon regulatory protein n=1 Tax=Kineococcus xinjiangensis TaxID=512762 RepID=A0A2S6IV31_9ACTN|nr:IclR family transcriptional regulator [Kineococcus xinjiangensis]PPK97914.1 DNA-binding IclR family transcriptional regulator [Kineococcus xinjiangensis]